MIYTIDKIKQDIRIAIDRNSSSSKLLLDEDIDTLTLEQIIRSKILEAVRKVEKVAPIEMLESGHPLYETNDIGDGGVDNREQLYWDGNKACGWVNLPDDFMRLVMFRMSDWERPVYTATAIGTDEYSKQSSRFAGIRGTTQKPVCVVAMRAWGKVLEFYGCKSQEAYVSEALYLPEPHIDENDGVDICEQCYTAVIYMAAALTLISIGENDLATQLVELSKSEIQ